MSQERRNTMQRLFIHILIYSGVCICHSYDFKCPYQSERKLRAFGHCNETFLMNYQCLFDELGKFQHTGNMFTESCKNKPDFVRRGNRYGLSGARQKKKCTQNTYQPFEFYSNSSHECHFSKSKCSEIGHISYNNGTTIEDTQCRCNYNTGYDYINTPENKCYCVPSKEDCSCYIKKCNATERLSPDYKCTHMKVGSSQPHCPPDVYKRNKYEIGPINIIKKNGFSPQQLTKGTRRSTVHYVLKGFIIFVIVVLCFIIGFATTNCLPQVWYIKLCPAIDLNTTLNQDCSIKLTWNIPETKYKQSKYKIEYTCDDWKTTLELEETDINSYCRISHVAPYRTYHFHVIYFCMCDGVVIESISSDQKTIVTSGPPVDINVTLNDDCSIKVTWAFPKTEYTIDKYNIEYTYDEWKTIMILETKEEHSSCRITNVVPYKTYRFRVAYYFSCDGYQDKHTTSELKSIETHSPKLTVRVEKLFRDKCIMITWSEPCNINVCIQQYTIRYTYDDWKTQTKLVFNPSELSGKLVTVLPLKTYRFIGFYKCKCSPRGLTDTTVEQIDSEPSNEVSIYTDIPGRPENSTTEGEDGNMKLLWSAPVETLFETVSYRIEYTIDGKWDNPVCHHQSASGRLEFTINNVKKLTVYQFRIYSCTHDDTASLPSQAIFSSKYCCKSEIAILEKAHEPGLSNPNSVPFKTLTDELIVAVEQQCKRLKGVQHCIIYNYRPGSLIVSFVLTSDGFFDETALRKAIEEPLKKGKLGRFTTRHDGFVFYALNMPSPPKIYEIINHDKRIIIKWKKQMKSFFGTHKFKLEITTDDWKTKETVYRPGWVFEYEKTGLSLATTYRFRICSCTEHLMESRPSKEVFTKVDIPSPVINMKVTFSYESSHDAYTLSWDQPDRSTDSNNIHYKVLVNGKHVHPARQIKERHYKFIPEDIGVTEYTFSVIACDMNGFESEKGEEVTCNKERVPLPPRNISATSVLRGIKVSWKKPLGLNRVKTYTLNITTDRKKFDSCDAITVDGSKKSYVVYKLMPLTKYFLCMSSCSFDSFEGCHGALVQCCTKEPHAPTTLRVVECYYGIKLKWSAPTFPYCNNLRNYNVYIKSENKETVEKTTMQSYLIKNLKRSSKYEFCCSTCTVNGLESKRSASVFYDSPSVAPRRYSI